jgi:hypothetical protein
MRPLISMLVRTSVIGGLGLAVAASEARAVVLITAQEAALPNAVGAPQLGVRGVTRGPKVLVLSPAPDAGLVRSPLDLVLKFETHGRSVIEPLSVKVIYLKNPTINLTQRIGHRERYQGAGRGSAVRHALHQGRGEGRCGPPWLDRFPADGGELIA